MVKFHNAADSEGRIVNIKDVSRENRAKRYFCIGCGAEMSAVLGDKREHHFRHKEDVCSWESYLHKLGKRKLKDRFKEQNDFVIGYFVENVCDKSDGCKLESIYSNNKCNRKELRRINLKELYDTCQEEEVTYKSYRADLMLSHSKYPEREPIFLEISVTHDCEPEKIASRIKIIELKISNEQDILRPLEEMNFLFLDTLSSNPYSYDSKPDIRFYNFERKFITKRPLSRFWISRDSSGMLHGYETQDNLNCQNVESNHREDSVFEVAIPAEVLINRQRCNLFEFGMMRAFKKNIDIKHCCFCARHNCCICTFNVEEVDKNSGKKQIVPRHFRMASLTDENINKYACASQCKNYIQNTYLINRIEQYYWQLPYWEWKQDDDKLFEMNNNCPF